MITVELYISASVSYIVLNVGTNEKGYLANAFKPSALFNEIISGNVSLIFITILILLFFILYHFYRKTSVDLTQGRR